MKNKIIFSFVIAAAPVCASFAAGGAKASGLNSTEAFIKSLAPAALASAPSGAEAAAPSRTDGKTYEVSRLEPYVQVHCGQGVGTAVKAIAGRVYLDVKVPAMEQGVVRFSPAPSGTLFSVDEASDFHIESQNGFWSAPRKIRVGRLQFEASCLPHNVDRDIETYVPVLFAADVRAGLAVRFNGACWSKSNWPNAPGRSYFRPIRIDLTLFRAGGDTLKLGKDDNLSYTDQESCENGFLPPGTGGTAAAPDPL